MEFRMGALFCGPGGIALGAHIAASRVDGISVKHAWANDYDLSTCETYMANIPGATDISVKHGDVRFLNIAELGQIDGLAFGFPCNDFSLVGEQKGTEGRFGPLYTYGVGVLNEYSPKWFVAENVGGLTSSNEGLAFLTILNALRNAGDFGGYKLYPHKYRFEEYGVPQARHRILIVGIRSDLPTEFKVPSPKPYEQIDNSAGTKLTIPPIPADAPNNELTKQSPTVVERLKHIKPGENAFTANLPEHLKLNVSGAKISQIYKRLQADKPSYTITGSGGGGTHVYHWSEPRALTNRERARLQTFPDNFLFKGSKESVRKQIGMAVPVEGAAVVFEALFKCFAGQNYESVEPNLKKYLNEADKLGAIKK